ncbi:MAG: [Fe-Fe] hydrogenase large subunit C-terminal domain-containing protein [Eubacteriales bacterium]|nr:[Fe-Fe] hydrogenase large subunit C-terminal domain-containing protein [Eubacteriales bacterium]
MQAHAKTNLRLLWRSAMDNRSVVVMSLLPDAAQTLCRRLGIQDQEHCEKSIGEYLKAVGVDEVLLNRSQLCAQNAAEAAELVKRLKGAVAHPLLLDSCPCWQERCPEELRAFFLPLPPDDRCRGLALRSLLSARRGVAFSRIIYVTVVGCSAHKDRYGRFQATPAACIGDDYVIGVRDLLLWLGLEGKLPKENTLHPPLPKAAAGRIGDVLSQASLLLEGKARPSSSFVFKTAPGYAGLLEGKCIIGGQTLRYAQLRGLCEAERLCQQLKAGRYDLLEIYSCACCG